MEITMLFSIVFVRKTDSKVSLQRNLCPKEQKKAFLFPLNQLFFQTSDRKKNMRNILKIEQKNTNLFSSDIRKNSILFFVSDLLNQVLRNESQNQNIFYEITNFLYELQTENFQSHLVFIFQLLKHQGLQPLFNQHVF